jgi:hypothetical protein
MSHQAEARDIRFEVTIDKSRIALGERAQLGLSFHETQSMPAPDISNIDGLEIRYLGPSTMMTVINGQMSSSVTHMYTVLPLRIGKFQIGPFSFKHKGDSYSSNMITLDVGEDRPVVQAQSRPSELARMNLKDRIFLTLNTEKATAYVNELIPVTVKMHVNRLNVSDIQLPTFDQEGFSKVDFKEPRQYREVLNGIVYDILEFKTSIFGTKAGDYRLGPAMIKCNVVVRKSTARGRSIDDFYGDDSFRDSFFEDFFARYERYPMELKSQDVQLIISPLPSESAPSDFTGAVGDYQFIFEANPKAMKAGDPITLKMTINGRGNFNTVLAPKIAKLDGFKVYEPQVKTEDGRKTFTQVMIPESDLVTEIPKVSFSYFDPAQKKYKTISHGNIPIKVEKAKSEAPSQVIGPLPVPEKEEPKDEDLKRDIIYIKESPGRWLSLRHQLYARRPFALAVALPLIFFIAVSIVQKRRERIINDSAYAQRIEAYRFANKHLKELKRRVKAAKPQEFYEQYANVLHGYMANRLHLSTAAVTADAVESALADKKADPDIIKRARDLFRICDEARFSSAKADTFKADTDFRELEVVIEYLERRKI